jgi:hypothetical protein
MTFGIDWQLVLTRSRESDFHFVYRKPSRTVVVRLVIRWHRHDDGREDLLDYVASVTKFAVSKLIPPSA